MSNLFEIFKIILASKQVSIFQNKLAARMLFQTPVNLFYPELITNSNHAGVQPQHSNYLRGR